MNEPTPTNPTPTAVPWTPDMQTQPAPVVSPAPSPVPAPLQPPVQQTAPAQPAYPATPQYQAAQPVAPQPAAPQPAAPHQPVQAYAPQPQAQPAPRVQQHAPAAQQPRYAQPTAPQHLAPMQAPHGHPPQAQPSHVQPPHAQHAHAQQPQVQQPQGQPVHGQYAPPAAPQHFPQAAIPPLDAAHAQTAAQAVPAESNSLIAKLLKRAPKAELAPAADIQMPQASESLFNKNFALGAVTGLVIGAFVLPMLLNKIGIGNAPAPKQALAAAPASVSNVAAPVPADAETFIDQAIAADTP